LLGLLFHQFYALPKSVDSSIEDNRLLTLLDDESLLSLGFVHFYGERKPWRENVDVAAFPTTVVLARNRWLQEFQGFSTVIAPKHVSPLTPNGVKQYRKALALYVSNFQPFSF
jgi:hypothetical protein